jgi:hypothetical protein
MEVGARGAVPLPGVPGKRWAKPCVNGSQSYSTRGLSSVCVLAPDVLSIPSRERPALPNNQARKLDPVQTTGPGTPGDTLSRRP